MNIQEPGAVGPRGSPSGLLQQQGLLAWDHVAALAPETQVSHLRAAPVLTASLQCDLCLHLIKEVLVRSWTPS
ncbi:hypothetical protein Y1Q_0015948 [Alligator mississippiensis]|uniref:Uncharacterized protein n=1 Tax=Alligator mississippiensis TaxID=8496 RepID=A0A151MUW3_ALLMI|nr:hypothetical protein Y1Q_0015948 [Alligator mississippiensis]